MPLSMSELIKTHQSEPAAAQSTTSWRAERRRRREYRGPEKPRSARAFTTMAPSNTHAFTQAAACLVTTVTHTHFVKKHVLWLTFEEGFTVNHDTYTGVSIFLHTVCAFWQCVWGKRLTLASKWRRSAELSRTPESRVQFSSHFTWKDSGCSYCFLTVLLFFLEIWCKSFC